MEMHQVRYFVTLCETLNFTKAAEACNVSQPSLTKAIHKLEDELGGPLFCRERGLTHLTRLGKIMEPHLKAVYASSETARAEANSFLNHGKATLLLGILNSVSPARFIDFFQDFHKHAPSITLDLQIDEKSAHLEKLLAGEIDAAIIDDTDLPDRCDTIPLYSEGYALAIPNDHRLSSQNSIHVTDLQDISLLPHDLTFSCLQNIPVKTMAQCNGKLNWSQSLVLAGLGCAILPHSTPCLQGVTVIPISEPSMERNVSLVTVSGRQHTPALRELRRSMTQHDWLRSE